VDDRGAKLTQQLSDIDEEIASLGPMSGQLKSRLDQSTPDQYHYLFACGEILREISAAPLRLMKLVYDQTHNPSA
jgi:hypothetical protein